MADLRTSPKDAFLHLLMMAMLYIGVISIITLAFSYIEYSYPDALYFYPEGILSSIRYTSAMLVVSFPILILLSWFIQREYRAQPEKHNLTFGKWLIYITLLIAAITIVIDLVQLVNGFYSGDLTTPFVLKTLVVLAVTGVVFAYFVWDVQSAPQNSKIPALTAWASSALVLGMLVLGFIVAGSPAHQRQIRMDAQRVSDLQSIQGEIINYWQYKNELPSDMSQLKNDLRGFVVPLDPELQTGYEYQKTGALTFDICANFSQPSPFSATQNRAVTAVPYYDGYSKAQSEIWDHEAGRQCFSRSIDPALYPKPTL